MEISGPVPYVSPVEYEERKPEPGPDSVSENVPEKNVERNSEPVDPTWQYSVYVERDRNRCTGNTEFMFRLQQKEKPENEFQPETVTELLDWFTKAQKDSQPIDYSDTLVIKLANGLEVLHRDSVVHIACKGWSKIQS